MKKQSYHCLIIMLLCSPVTTMAYNYPTLTRVEFTLQCMDRQGGKSYQTLYPCVCMIDKIAEEMNQEDFVQSQTFTYLKSTPGEKGGLFRDPPQAGLLRQRLKEVKEKARAICFVQ